MRERFFLTTAIDYVNSRPHLGTAYEKIAADCIARAHRFLGRDVLFVMGNDEHSINVAKAAAREGLDPLAYCDRMEAEFRETWRRLDISFDDFIRTTEPRHRRAVQELLRRVEANGWLRKDRYTGWYCEGCEAFYTEKDLVDGKCPNHDTKPVWVEEENWFFRLSAFERPLLEHIHANPEFIRPETRRNEVVSFLESGLADLSISRAGSTWGIPFPNDHEHVVYVWFDALINYISAAGFAADDEKFAKWWPADCHVVGKDITRFHCVIWPAMLMAAGLELPKSVFGHGFVYQSGRKMSKSLGNIVNPLDVVAVTGADALRYFLLREITFGKDGDFTWDAFIQRYNADLANDLGNLVQRSTDMVAKFLEGEVAAGTDRGVDRTGLGGAARETVSAALRAYERFDLSEALTVVWGLVRRANQAVQEARPWEIAREPQRRDELSGVLSEILEAVRIVAVLAEPALPGKAAAIRERLGLPARDPAPWSASTVWRERPGWRIGRGEAIFPRLAPLKEEANVSEAAAPGRTIPIDAFRDVELVVATIRSAARVDGADRLLRVTLDVGGNEREVVAGIAEHFRPEELAGRQVVLVANLEPAKIRGIESRGMILAAKSGNRLVLLGPQGEIESGAKIS
ncbi:MAG: methionine--tRNA ligase [Candidatus Eiseniibacteriota bacterium]